MSPVVKPSHIRELGLVDIAALKAQVARVSERVWNAEDESKENRFDCFHHTRHIVFRFIEGMRDHRRYYSTPLWPAWQDALLPVLEEASAPYGFARPIYPKVMLARLAANAVIDRHVDGGGSNLYTHKIHVPLQTSPESRMFIHDLPFHLAEGVAYEVNNLAPHSVENTGETDRIHLIFELFDEGDAPLA
jgi:hypothetical protein